MLKNNEGDLMNVETKYSFGQHVRHGLNGFQGHITGIMIFPTHTAYEVLPLTDSNASWRDGVWISEVHLILVE